MNSADSGKSAVVEAGPGAAAGNGGRTLAQLDRAGVRALVTARELEVWRMRALGLSLKETASALDVSVKTIETQTSALNKKLHTQNCADLARLAVRYGIIEVEVLPA